MVPRSAKLEGFSRLLSLAIWQRKQIALLLFRQVVSHFLKFSTCYREAVVSSVARDHVWLYIRDRTMFAVESKRAGKANESEKSKEKLIFSRHGSKRPGVGKIPGAGLSNFPTGLYSPPGRIFLSFGI